MKKPSVAKIENKEAVREAIYRTRHGRYGNASLKVSNAIIAGNLVKQPCEICGAEPAQAHHDDYNKPLDVRWLCKKHHTEWHKTNQPKYLEEAEC